MIDVVSGVVLYLTLLWLGAPTWAAFGIAYLGYLLFKAEHR